MTDSLTSLAEELRQVVGESPVTLTLPLEAKDMSPEDFEDFLSECLTNDFVEGKMDPFKRKGTLGPGPRKRVFKKRKKDRFRCKCAKAGSGLLCKCKTKRGLKNVHVSFDYKNYYNTVYRTWLKKRRKKPKKKPAAKAA